MISAARKLWFPTPSNSVAASPAGRVTLESRQRLLQRPNIILPIVNFVPVLTNALRLCQTFRETATECCFSVIAIVAVLLSATEIISAVTEW